ncbi:hypothetical protein [Pyrobaculum sp.]|uniref:hypothetical protein n=1 Tax=Pyrobaculum sp. TaxID=2004705 RepID=UPI003178317B
MGRIPMAKTHINQTQTPAAAGEIEKAFLVKLVESSIILFNGKVLDDGELEHYLVKLEDDKKIPLYNYHEADYIIAAIKHKDELYLIVQDDLGRIGLITYKLVEEHEEGGQE